METRFTHKEELWNTWTHAAGIVLGVAAGVYFLAICLRGGDAQATFSVLLYLFGMLSCYVSSTAYHAVSPQSVWKRRLRKFDHAAIYWHIAGSYAPLTLIAMRHTPWGYILFAFVWLCAIAGTFMSFARLKDHSHLETVCFVAMGLSVLAAFKPFADSVSLAAVLFVVAEGVFYITGALFYSLRHLRNNHAVFHFFVLAGTLCHILAVRDVLMQYVG